MIFDAMWKLQRERRKSVKFYDKEIKKLRAKKQTDKIEEWEYEASTELSRIDTMIRITASGILVQNAHSLLVPVPDYQDKDSWENYWGSYLLTDKAFDALRAKIRQEIKDRRENAWFHFRTVVLPIAAIIISILSIFIAWLNFRKH